MLGLHAPEAGRGEGPLSLLSVRRGSQASRRSGAASSADSQPRSALRDNAVGGAGRTEGEPMSRSGSSPRWRIRGPIGESG